MFKGLNILAVGTEWSSGNGGVSTFNRQLCRAIAAAGASVICLLPSVSADDRINAGAIGLVEATKTPGLAGRDALARKPQLPSHFLPDVIIGHGRVTGPAARVLVEDHFPLAKRIHFVHTAPDEIEWFKSDRDDDAGLRADERTRIELELGRTADRMVAVGPRLHQRYLNDLSIYNVPPPIRFDPGFDIEKTTARTPPPGTPWKILVLGRLEDHNLKGLDLAAKAAGLAAGWRDETGDTIELTARGARPDTSSKLRDQLTTWARNPRLKIVARPFTSDSDTVDAELRRASLVLMPSRAEGFGLIGLESIVAGTPALVSSESGLADLLREHLSKEQIARIVVRVTNDFATDQSTWARAIESILRDREAAFHRTHEARELLSKKITWQQSVENLLLEFVPKNFLSTSNPLDPTLDTAKTPRTELPNTNRHASSTAPPHLSRSTPATFEVDSQIRCINDYEPKPDLFGRINETNATVNALLNGTPIFIAGGPGMGKTTVATASLYDPRIVERFGRRRVFATLEAATDARAIASKLVEALGIPPIGNEATLLRILSANAAESHIAAVLDNAETILDVDRAEAERLLKLIARISGLSLAITIRGVPPPLPGAISIDNLAKLDPEAARDAFLSNSGDQFATDPDLGHLLEALDGHALSICLVAAQAVGLSSLNGLRESWDEAHAEILRRPGEREGRLNSVSASLSLTLSSRRMISNPHARRLMALIGLLPGGLPEDAVVRLLGDRGTVPKSRAHEAIACLHQLRLVEKRLDKRLRMLTPIRECIKKDVPALSIDRHRLIEHYLAIAEKGYSIGENEWEKVKTEVEEESDNLDSICELAIHTKHPINRLRKAIAGLSEFSSASGRATTNSLELLATSQPSKASPELAAECVFRIGKQRQSQADHQAAQRKFEEALDIFQTIKNLGGEANCISSLANLARLRSENDTAKAQFEEALGIYRRIKAPLGEANCIHNLAIIASLNGDYEVALAKTYEALTIYRRIGRALGEANCIRGLGELAYRRSNNQEARANFTEALLISKRIGDSVGEANCTLELGSIALGCSNQKDAQERFEQAREMYKGIGDQLGEAHCLLSFGDIALTRSDERTASMNFYMALEIYQRVGDVVGKAQCTLRFGEIAYLSGNACEAQTKFEEALKIHREISTPIGEASSIYGLAQVARSRLQYDAAQQNLEKAMEIYRRTSIVKWQAITLIQLGRIKQRRGIFQNCFEDIEAGFDLLFKHRDPEDRAIDGWFLLRDALLAKDSSQAASKIEEAKLCWTEIERRDLITEWLSAN